MVLGIKPDMTEAKAMERRRNIEKALFEIDKSPLGNSLIEGLVPELQGKLGQKMTDAEKARYKGALESELKWLNRFLPESVKEDVTQSLNDPLGIR